MAACRRFGGWALCSTRGRPCCSGLQRATACASVQVPPVFIIGSGGRASISISVGARLLTTHAVQSSRGRGSPGPSRVNPAETQQRPWLLIQTSPKSTTELLWWTLELHLINPYLPLRNTSLRLPPLLSSTPRSFSLRAHRTPSLSLFSIIYASLPTLSSSSLHHRLPSFASLNPPRADLLEMTGRY